MSGLCAVRYLRRRDALIPGRPGERGCVSASCRRRGAVAALGEERRLGGVGRA